ncbi:hypothetical protein CGRA01v4_01572 [Colletotrichum graminicola]|uniref:Uncharacterized protein n=1 Tax=Colletotrichum graminicola (strain M1.001 / M2 / FGSC 10212) TaxID=645133 RepID=E3QY24_COLGM|nr:uncharacterized protein GLRG_10917 [Colletotrichum graminicola M1.001]EFQ35762.1 hypothetical protein GLRG_10917 [Colletotrichum graminicola M1.001]WDK10293.1 hypothetical protein CGRA01v4_01572 [Colletotrichum graminicola]
MRLVSLSLMGSSLLTGPALATVPILTEVSLRGCADISCPAGAVDELVGESNCTLGSSVLRRVGIAPEVIDIPLDDSDMADIRKLSLTVATVAQAGAGAGSVQGGGGGSSSSRGGWMKKQIYTQSYYLGAPAGLDLASDRYPKGCALIFQHLFQTLPIAHEVPDPDTTDCSPWLQQSCMDEITGYVDDFRADHAGNETLPRCQEMAMYLEDRTRRDRNFRCNLIAGAVNITGAEIIGPDAPTELVAQAPGDGGSGDDGDDDNDDDDNDNRCHPTLPSSYNLLKLTDVELILDSEGSTTRPTGGLNGYTPVMSVLFDKLLYSQWICMKTMSEFDARNSGTMTATPVIAGLVMGLATVLAILLL